LEAAELLELFQWDNRNDEESLKTDNKYQLLKDELSDVIIYCLTMANSMHIDLSESITHKMEKNILPPVSIYCINTLYSLIPTIFSLISNQNTPHCSAID